MRFGKVDVAWTGNKGAMGMVDRSGGEIFAQAISAGGESGYYSLLIVNKDSSLKTLDDVLSHAKDLTSSKAIPIPLPATSCPVTTFSRNVTSIRGKFLSAP